jgi:hypothetical protein
MFILRCQNPVEITMIQKQHTINHVDCVYVHHTALATITTTPGMF